MREILFRGKRIDDGEWLQGYLWDGNDSSYIIPHSLGMNYYEKEKRMMAFASEVDPETVCQYTGLTDENGRKIFEGDIFKHHFNKSTISIVKYGEYRNPFNDDEHTGHVGFYVDWLEKKHVLRADLGYWAKLSKVIGNIFDNPELAKQHENWAD